MNWYLIVVSLMTNDIELHVLFGNCIAFKFKCVQMGVVCVMQGSPFVCCH